LKSILDACSTTFLTNGNLLDIVLRIEGRTWYIGQIVFEECRYKGTIIPRLEQAVNGGRITPLDDSTINAVDFLNLLQTHGLGDGETECLIHALSSDFVVCSDDKKARRVCASLLGKNRVIGTLTLMLEAVDSDLISSDDAMTAYQLMKTKGAFLPDVSADFFSKK
jgi:predicted nucleic acid-binding protein